MCISSAETLQPKIYPFTTFYYTFCIVCVQYSINLTIGCNIHIHIQRVFSYATYVYIIEVFLFPYLNLCAQGSFTPMFPSNSCVYTYIYTGVIISLETTLIPFIQFLIFLISFENVLFVFCSYDRLASTVSYRYLHNILFMFSSNICFICINNTIIIYYNLISFNFVFIHLQN